MTKKQKPPDITENVESAPTSETNNFMPKGWGQQLADSLNKAVREEAARDAERASEKKNKS